MKLSKMRLSVLLLACVLTMPICAQESMRSADLAGWWSADPVHGGETTHVALQFVETDGKLEAHLSAPAIDAYDFSLGAVSIDGNTITPADAKFPLTWNPAKQTLSGNLPADISPVYNIPIVFKRGEPLTQPPPREWKAPRPKVVWTVDTGAAVWAGIERADDGMLYVANEAGTVHAIDAAGKVQWKFESGGAVRGQPNAVGRHLYIASDSGFLYRLQRETGTVVWRAAIGKDLPPRLPGYDPKTRWDRYGSSVATDARNVYVASRDKNLYAFDVDTGREVWRVAGTDIMTATPALYRDMVLFADYAGKVRAVAAKDGAPRWSYDAKLAVPGDLTIAGDRVLLGSRSYDLIALDAKSGRERWKHYYWFSWIESPPVVRDGVVYTGSSDATAVYAIDLASGKSKWTTAVPGYTWQRPAVNDRWLVTGTVGAGPYPGSRAGSLLALDRATGAIRWIYLDPPTAEQAKPRTSWGFAAAPVVAGGAVYAADLAGKVYRLE